MCPNPVFLCVKVRFIDLEARIFKVEGEWFQTDLLSDIALGEFIGIFKPSRYWTNSTIVLKARISLCIITFLRHVAVFIVLNFSFRSRVPWFSKYLFRLFRILCAFPRKISERHRLIRTENHRQEVQLRVAMSPLFLSLKVIREFLFRIYVFSFGESLSIVSYRKFSSCPSNSSQWLASFAHKPSGGRVSPSVVTTIAEVPFWSICA